MKRFIAALIITVFLAAPLHAQAYVRPGLLPGAWWVTSPAGPPVTVQPMQRYRIWVPWWRRTPPVIYYPAPQQQAPTWGQFQGQWGFGQPPTMGGNQNGQ
jgi:hypothetical protein